MTSFWLLVVVRRAPATQVATRVRLIAAARYFLSRPLRVRVSRFIDVASREADDPERSSLACHALVFWAVALGGYTALEFLYGRAS
jgi:hypothetical protein